MDLLSSYGRSSGSDSDGESGASAGSPPGSPKLRKPSLAIVAAPAVDTAGYAPPEGAVASGALSRHLLPASARSTTYNFPASVLLAPVEGPASAAGKAPGFAPTNHRGGQVEDAFLSRQAFDSQLNAFERTGVAADPSGGGWVRDPSRAPGTGRAGGSGSGYAPWRPGRGGGGALAPADRPEKRHRTSRRQADPPGTTLESLGPFRLVSRQPWAAPERMAKPPSGPPEVLAAVAAEEAAEGEAGGEAARAPAEAVAGQSGAGAPAAAAAAAGEGAPAGAQVFPSSKFHGKSLVDYQGRSWMSVPSDSKPKAPEKCFVPKKEVGRWVGHTKGVNAVRFIPETGHLLASAGLDGEVKIWSVDGSYRCLRTCSGHRKGVRDVWWSNDGRRLLSAGFDRLVRVWDVETGTVLNTLLEGRMSYTARFHPDDGRQNVVLAGCDDKKILQVDLSSGGDVVQAYDYHLGAVNTVTFIDQNRRFISTSDDKTIRVWEFGIPVQIKVIAEPTMHAISSACTTHSGRWWLGQGQDNIIHSYSAGDRVKINKKKAFKGHVVSGYACDLAMAPDDTSIVSGDGQGKLFFWDWKSGRIAKSFQAHAGVTSGVAWNPAAASGVASCGWDGIIKYWD